MDKSDEDRIVKFLEIGATMLAEHHDCGAPMFRYKGEVFCPVCDYDRMTGKRQQPPKAEHAPAAAPLPRESGTEAAGTKEDAVGKLVSDKINELARNMQRETELSRIRDQMDCIERGIRILRLLQS
ncbi:MAG TPA: hypothetical protein HA257_08275 [Candidatus Methanoperedenaceae archaeon]|nr:hypothetical protein [Candidatus Methanoperedenaceae archaeon]